MTRALLLVALLGSGCYLHREYDRNAPGDTDLTVPPAGRMEPPTDPGRQGVLLSGGLLGAGGREFGGGKPGHWGGELDLELSAAYFATGRGALEEPEHLPPLTGVNLGYALAGSDLTRHRLYFELQHTRDLLGAAAGWTYRPEDGAQGPQATLFYGPLFLRLGYAFDHGGEAYLGLTLKGYAKLSWFR